MATDKDYKSVGLTASGIKSARRIDEWLELIVDEVTETGAGVDPWDVRDFIKRCVDATALSNQRYRTFVAHNDRL